MKSQASPPDQSDHLPPFVRSGCFFATANCFLKAFQEATGEQRILIWSDLPSHLRRELANAGPRLFFLETDLQVKTAIVRALGEHWPAGDLGMLGKSLQIDHLPLREVILKTLSQQAPEKLKKQLPGLLTHSEIRIKALAIQGLAKFDLEEAVAHVEHLLLEGKNPGEKEAGLQCCLFFPFPLIKASLLRFIARESSSELLEKAGLLLQANPEPEVTCKLWELSESGHPQKQEIHRILHMVLEGLKAIMPEEAFSQFTEKLKAWIGKRSVQQFIHKLIPLLEAPEEPNPDTLSGISRFLDNPRFHEFFNESLEWPMNERARERLRRIITRHVVPPPATSPTMTVPQTISPSPPTEPGPNTAPGRSAHRESCPSSAPENVSPIDLTILDTLSGRKLLFALASLIPADRERVEASLQRLLGQKNLAPEVITMGLKKALALGIPGFSQLAWDNLNVADPPLAESAIGYLGEFDSENLFPHLGRYLSQDNQRIKVAALMVMKKYDPAQAVSALKALFSHKDPAKQATATACLVHFDFPLIDKLITDLLLEKSPAIELPQALCLFRLNPSVENLFHLYRLEKSRVAQDADEIRKTREANRKFLLESGIFAPKTLAEIESGFADKSVREEQRQAAPAPYAVKTLWKSTAPKPTPESPPFLQPVILQVAMTISLFLGAFVVGRLLFNLVPN